MIAVEIDGGTWTQGRHNRGGGYTKDCEKFNQATIQGWDVYHFTGDMIKDGRATQFMEDLALMKPELKK